MIKRKTILVSNFGIENHTRLVLSNAKTGRVNHLQKNKYTIDINITRRLTTHKPVFSFVNKDYSEYVIDKDYISNLEQKFNIVFPKALKEYYLFHNNAEINTYKFCYLEIVEILPIFYGPNSVESIIFKNKINKIIPLNYIPFAVDKYERIIYWNNDDKKVYMFRRKNSNVSTLISNGVDAVLK